MHSRQTPEVAHEVAQSFAERYGGLIMNRQFVGFCTLTLLIFVLCVVRRPWMMIKPTLYAEDGVPFYFDQMISTSWSTLLQPFAAGYALPVPRIAALLASWVPPPWVPYVFNGVGLLVSSLCCALLSLSRFRSILRSDTGRVVLCLLFALSLDNTEVLMNACNSFWMLAIPVFLFAFVPPTAGRMVPQLLLFLGSLALTYATPVGVLAAPLAVFGMFRQGRPGRRAWYAGLLIGAAINLCIHAIASGRAAEVTSVKPALIAFIVSICQRVILSSIVGYTSTMRSMAAARVLPPLLALIGFTLLISFLLMQGNRSSRGRCLLGLYVLFATVGEALVGRHLFSGFQQMTGPSVTSLGARYFFPGSCALAFLVALAVEQLFSERFRMPASSGVPATPILVPASSYVLDALVGAIVLAVFAVGLVRNFRPNAEAYSPWQAYAGRIESWEKARSVALKNRAASFAVVPVSIPIQPFWYVCLPGTSIVNGSFEDTDVRPWVPYGSIDVAVVRSPHYEGRQSVALRGPDGGVYANYAELVPFRAGTKIQVSAYARTDPDGSGLGLLWVSDTAEAGVMDGPRPTSSTWQKFSVQFTVTSTHSMRIHLAGRGGVVYWDDVEVNAR